MGAQEELTRVDQPTRADTIYMVLYRVDGVTPEGTWELLAAGVPARRASEARRKAVEATPDMVEKAMGVWKGRVYVTAIANFTEELLEVEPPPDPPAPRIKV